MAITVQLPSGEQVTVSKDTAIIGQDDQCDVCLPHYAGLEPRHARIRKVADRWLIESLGNWQVQVQGGDPSRMAWLRPGDVISLTPGGLRITFEPRMAVDTTRNPVVEPKSRTEPPPLPRTSDRDRDSSSDDHQDSELSWNEGRKQPRTTPPPLPSERSKGGTQKPSEPPPPPSRSGHVDGHQQSAAKDQKIATWVFGSILLTFFLGVFMFAPKELPEFKQRMLALASAVLAGFFGFFFTGSIHLELKVVKKLFGELGVKATGGAALFTLVLVWWLSPLAPVKPSLSLKPIQFSPEVNQISILSKDVQTIYYSFDGKTWRQAAGVESRETGFEGINFTMGRIDDAGATKGGKVYIKYVTKTGDESIVKEFNYDPGVLGKLGRPISIAEMGRSNYSGKNVTENDFKRMLDEHSTRELILSNASFDEENLKYVKLIRPNIVRLSNTQVTNRGVKYLEGMTLLEQLDLAGTAIMDESMRVIAGLFSLQALNLSNTGITDEGVELYCEPRTHHHLKLVDLRGTRVTDRGVRRLRENIVPSSIDATIQIMR